MELGPYVTRLAADSGLSAQTQDGADTWKCTVEKQQQVFGHTNPKCFRSRLKNSRPEGYRELGWEDLGNLTRGKRLEEQTGLSEKQRNRWGTGVREERGGHAAGPREMEQKREVKEQGGESVYLKRNFLYKIIMGA